MKDEVGRNSSFILPPSSFHFVYHPKAFSAQNRCPRRCVGCTRGSTTGGPGGGIGAGGAGGGEGNGIGGDCICPTSAKSAESDAMSNPFGAMSASLRKSCARIA